MNKEGINLGNIKSENVKYDTAEIRDAVLDAEKEDIFEKNNIYKLQYEIEELGKEVDSLEILMEDSEKDEEYKEFNKKKDDMEFLMKSKEKEKLKLENKIKEKEKNTPKYQDLMELKKENSN